MKTYNKNKWGKQKSCLLLKYKPHIPRSCYKPYKKERTRDKKAYKI